MHAARSIRTRSNTSGKSCSTKHRPTSPRSAAPSPAGGRWTPLTTPEWLLRHADQLEWQRFDYPIAIHDSCHVTKKVGKPQPARDLLAQMADVVEIAESPTSCVCCGYYNIHANHDLNHDLHQEKLSVVREKGGEGMAVECVTCWESFATDFKEAEVPLWELMVAAEQATRPGEVDRG